MKTHNKFDDKVAVITGAGSGIGRALARQLSASGAHLALVDLDAGGLEGTAASLTGGGAVTRHVVDVADRAAYQAFVAKVIDAHERVDIVINNAGIVRLHSVSDGTYADYERTMQVNFWGVLHGCKEFLPHLVRRPEAWLVNVSSVAGLIGLTNYSSYSSSKFAVRGLTESLRVELRGTNVRVACVHPSGVATNINTSAEHGAGMEESAARMQAVMTMPVEDAADVILAGMAKGRRRILVGRDAKVMDVIARLFPSAYDAIVARYS